MIKMSLVPILTAPLRKVAILFIPLSENTPIAVGPFYMMSMPGEVK